MYGKLDNDHNVIKCEHSEFSAWAQQMGDDFNRVAADDDGTRELSTIFLGRNLGGYEGLDQWFETAIHENDEWRVLDRYETWDQAVLMHAYYKNMFMILDAVVEEYVQPVADSLGKTKGKRNVKL
jgi:hypothetical protein